MEEHVVQQSKIEQQTSVLLVTFRLEDEMYGIDINDVQEVINLPPVTPVPRSVGFLEGVINLRGQVIPVVNLRRRFNMLCSDYTEDTRIIIIKHGENSTGLVVDMVSEVVRVNSRRISTTANVISAVNSAFIQGVVRIKNSIVTVLNPLAVISLSAEEKRQHDRLLQEKSRRNLLRFVKRSDL